MGSDPQLESLFALEMDRETFDIMWEMSAPGHPAEECFLRGRQEEFYCEEDLALSGPFDHMPDVRRFLHPRPSWPINMPSIK